MRSHRFAAEALAAGWLAVFSCAPAAAASTDQDAVSVPAQPAGGGSAAPAAPRIEDLRAAYDALRSVALDPTRSVTVDKLQVGREAMDIELTSGRLFFAKPWREGAAPTAALFIGEGRARYTPPDPLEAKQFKGNWKGKDKLEEPFQRAFLLFNDDLWESLKDRLAPDTATPEALKLFDARQKALEDLLFSFEIPVLEDLLSARKLHPGRLVEFETAEEGWLSWFYQPWEPEENTLFRHKRVGFADFQNASEVSVWQDRKDYDSKRDLEAENKDLLSVEHYDADFTVKPSTLLLEARVRVDFISRVEGLGAAPFAFVTYYDFAGKQKEFKISSITLPDGTPLPYIHDNFQLLVQFDRPLRTGEGRSIVVTYTADFIRPDPSIGSFFPQREVPLSIDWLDAEASTYTLLNTYPWFPQYGYLRRSSFDWRIKVPKPFVALGSGTTIKRWEEGPYNCVRKSENVKVLLASWLFGRYKLYTDEKDTARPKIWVASLPKQQGQLEDLYRQSRNVIKWYEQWANPFPYEELDVVQMGFNYGFGQAPPGLVQLTGEAFLSPSQLNVLTSNSPRAKPTFIYGFVAHEIGHQWWAHVVSWNSYHDQWLSESFTEYLAGLYVGDLRGPKAFDEVRTAWRDGATQVPGGGSIWMGQRSGKWYFPITYSKGPYVLHMLRLNMQAQFGPEEGDKKFFASLRTFLDRFRHQITSTNELIAVINQVTGSNYAPFFDQWFRGFGIPEIKFTYSVRPTEDGKFIVSAKAVQADKENLKAFRLPVGLQFGEKTLVRFIDIRDEQTDWQIKVPSVPDRVIVNEGDGILAKVKVEKS